MAAIIRNDWQSLEGAPLQGAQILSATRDPEGLSLMRLRASGPGEWALPGEGGHLLSVLSGFVECEERGIPMRLEALTHTFFPHGKKLTFSDDFQGVLVSASSQEQVAGDTLLVRDERYLRACMGQRPLRWILTPQYLSRRAFLHHDKTLLSRAGHPISWFRTTMFDVAGLPPNEEGQPVFRMSYNHRTEPNVCYDVTGNARVRMAQHPYSAERQRWGSWQLLDNETTYYLDEAADGPEVEWLAGGPRRNKHEVSVEGGHVSLLCLFDPAPTGAEQHRPGAYSDYGPLADVLGTGAHDDWLEEHARWDPVVSQLSLSKAQGEEHAPEDVARLEEGLRALADYQAQELHELRVSAPERADTFARWMDPPGWTPW